MMNKKHKYIYILLSVIISTAAITGCSDTRNAAFEEAETTVLPIPALLEDSNSDPDVADYELTARLGSSTFFEDKKTQTMGYNGNFLGPVMIVKRGEQVNMHVKNDLNEDTSVHWHGLKVSGDKDGGPHQIIKPGEIWEPSFVINQPAATLWFHPHVIGSTASQVYYGLAGVMIVEDDVSAELDLPKTYGVDDIPLILQDRSFNSDGSFNYNSNMMDGTIGDTIIVNGAIAPTLEVSQAKMRFRIINGANASNFNLTVDDGVQFYQIASDGGFLESPVLEKSLFISPGERAEIVVDFSRFEKGQTVAMKSGDSDVMYFRIADSQKDDTIIPDELAEIERMKIDSSTPVKRIELDGMGHMVAINGRKFDMERIDDVAELGVIEVWEITSAASMMHSMGHPFHIHGVQFQILSRSSGQLSSNELGWKDTVFVAPGETVKIMVQFEEKGIFMYHCHILEHEEAGMMGQIRVE